MNNKDTAFARFTGTISQSWTYNRMTESEKANWNTLVSDELGLGHIFGTFEQRIKIMNGLYNAYLIGIGYNGAYWREPNPDSVPKF